MIDLYPHQREALQETEGLQNIGVYHDMGLGKTFTGSEMMKRFNCKTNLVVCQKSKIVDWMNHFYKYYSCELIIFDLTIPEELVGFLGGEESDVHRVGVINYDLMWRRPELLKLNDFVLMLDESSLIQHSRSKRTKFVLKLKPSHTILLSGTPVGGKYENLWTQIHLLGWGISKRVYEQQYVNWDTIRIGRMKHKVVSKTKPYKNVERLKTKMREYGAIFKKTEECYELPAQIDVPVIIEPPKEYRRFLKNRIVTVEGNELVGDTSLTKLLYARQLCSQYNKQKLKALSDLIESTGERLIIFYSFNDELEKIRAICEDLERPVSEINGHRKDLKAYEEESDSVTLCQYQSASKGLNLQKCNRIIYFSLPLSSEDFEQSKKRIHRIGQEKTCFYYLMVCRNTVEKEIQKVLEKRKDYTDELFKKTYETCH